MQCVYSNANWMHCNDIHFVEDVRGNTFTCEVSVAPFTNTVVAWEKVTQFGVKCITEAHPRYTVRCKKGKIGKARKNSTFGKMFWHAGGEMHIYICAKCSFRSTFIRAQRNNEEAEFKRYIKKRYCGAKSIQSSMGWFGQQWNIWKATEKSRGDL